MKIAVHAQELEALRIDGTRNYLAHVLSAFGENEKQDHEYFLIHKDQVFNPEHELPEGLHFHDIKTRPSALWTQNSFARVLRSLKPDVLWMPIHNVPVFRPAGARVVVTIHDLAFKLFPETFPFFDRLKHNLQTRYALGAADHVIAVSDSTKKDILTYYPFVDPDKIIVIHHGIDCSEWRNRPIVGSQAVSGEPATVRDRFGLQGKYIVYVGALQPRKNLVALIESFTLLRRNVESIQLVLAGEPAWLSESTLAARAKSYYADDIIVTGILSQDDLAVVLSGAEICVYPSLYEGFGMPLLEAFAIGVPVLCGKNSSLPEVAGDAAFFSDISSASIMANDMQRLLDDSVLRAELIRRGKSRASDFSWEKTARETLAVLIEGTSSH